ncbi:unnamed protein product [Bursaphelenchus xylophilus]|uniref:(pine wood nematode) hypothetical protein n=1 Tax=Bursaphelenchus xylophilus TaxID=6326 RepID=A0A1I7RJD3_BURXY|nr:unnamed protein product [Bursaphelenchus xylophilus]CAG9128803.1 unnamed protein product [Bursaphelenchus xylophilus]
MSKVQRVLFKSPSALTLLQCKVDNMIKFLILAGFVATVAGKATFINAKPSPQDFADLVKTSKLGLSPFCSTCEQVINAIKGPLEALTELSKEEVEAAVETACDEVVGPLGPVCASFIDREIDVLYKVIEQDEDNINAEECCAAISLC